MLLFSILIAIFAIVPLRNIANERANAIKNSLMNQLETTLGIQLNYESISPALLSAVTIKGLEVDFENGSFSARRFRVFLKPRWRTEGLRYNFSDWITRVNISQGVLNLSIQELNNSPKSPLDNKELIRLLQSKTIVFKDCTAYIATNDIGNIYAERFTLRLNESQGTIYYNFTSFMRTEQFMPLEQLGEVSLALNTVGSYSAQDTTVNGRVDILSLNSDLIRLKPISASFTYNEGKFSLQHINDDRPIDISLHIADENITTSGVLVDLPLDDVIYSGISNPTWDPWFATIFDGEFSFSIDSQTRDIFYDLNMDFSFSQETVLPWPWKATLDIKGNQNMANVSELELALPWGEAKYTGRLQLDTFAPFGWLYIDINEKWIGYPISTTLQIRTIENAIVGKQNRFVAGDIAFQEFHFILIRDEKHYTMSLKASPENPDDNKHGEIILDAMLDMENQPVVYGFADINNFQASDIAKILGKTSLSRINPIQDSIINLRGSFESNFDIWMMNIEDISLQSQKNPENIITVRGSLLPNDWSVDSLRITWDGYIIDGYGSVNENSANGQVIIEDELYSINLDWVPSGPMHLVSDSGIEIIMGPPTRNGRTMALQLTDFDIPLNNKLIRSNVGLRGLVGNETWEVFLKNAQFTILEEEELISPSLVLDGRINAETWELSQIKFTDTFGSLTGNAEFFLPQSKERTSANIFLSSNTGEYYKVSAVQENTNWEIDLDIKAGRIDRMGLTDIKGAVNLQGNFTGTLEDPLIHVEISTQDASFDESPFTLSGKANISSGHLNVHDIRMLFQGVSVTDGLILADMEVGSIRATARCKANYNQVPVNTGFSLGMDFNQKISVMDISSLLQSDFSGTLATLPLNWDEQMHMPPLTFQFEKNKDTFIVQTPNQKTLLMKYSFADGQLNFLSDTPMPFLVHGGGTIKDGQVNLSFPSIEIDPILINYFMVRDPILFQYHVVFQEGKLIGNLDITGPIASPNLDGKIRALNLKVDTPYTHADIQAASSEIVLEGNRITFGRIEVPVGEGIAYGEGFLELTNWKISEYDMIYGSRARGNGTGVPISYPLVGVYIDGFMTGEIHMTGDSQEFNIDGDIRLPSLKMSLVSSRVPIEVQAKRRGQKPVQVNLSIETGVNCSFYLPNEQLKIVKATAEPNEKIILTYRSDPEDFSLTGTIPIKSGDIYYFDRTFQISDGAMIFNESLNDFAPVIQIRAETWVRDNENEEVAVVLVYDAPINADFNPNIETVPSRSQVEILALFGQAVVPFGDSGESKLSSVLMATSGIFAQIGLVQPFEEVIRRGLNLDIVTIQTDIIENTLAESLRLNTDSIVSNRFSGLGRYLDNTSLYAGKYIGHSLFASGSVSARYFEGQRLSSIFGGLELETSVSLEMTTPFFNVEWSYTPNPTKTQSFIEDNAISLKWHFTY